MAENFLNPGREMDIRTHKAQNIPHGLNPKRATPKLIIIKLLKVKDKEFQKQQGKKKITYKGIPMRLSVDFSKETFQARKDCNAICKILEVGNCQPRIRYPEKLSFRNEGGTKTFPNKNKKKAEGVHYHQICFRENAKGTFSIDSKRMLINIIKNFKRQCKTQWLL